MKKAHPSGVSFFYNFQKKFGISAKGLFRLNNFLKKS